MKLPNLTRPVDALIGDEDQTGKNMKEQKERNWERVSNSVLEYSVFSYDTYGSYGLHILLSQLGSQGYILLLLLLLLSLLAFTSTISKRSLEKGKDRKTRKSRSEKKGVGLAQPSYSLQGNGRQSLKVEPGG